MRITGLMMLCLLASACAPTDRAPPSMAAAEPTAPSRGPGAAPVAQRTLPLPQADVARTYRIAVLGGMGNIGGTLAAAMILGVAESLMSTFSGPSWSLAVSFGILLLVLAVRPAGLFGR